jgi:hypothetical protein
MVVKKELKNFQNTDGDQLTAPNRDCFSKFAVSCQRTRFHFIMNFSSLEKNMEIPFAETKVG